MRRGKDDVMWLGKRNTLHFCQDLAEFIEEQGFNIPVGRSITWSEFFEIWELVEEWWEEVQ